MYASKSTEESNQTDRGISYEMRLRECDLATLEIRRLRGDQTLIPALIRALLPEDVLCERIRVGLFLQLLN